MATHIGVLPLDVLESLTIQLDEKLGTDAQAASSSGFLRLPHPRTGITSLFLPTRSASSGASSILEIQNVAPNANRSWFNGGNVISDGNLLLMTPVDPAFLLLPFLKAVSPQDGSAGNFRTLDDIFEEAAAKLSESNKGITDASEGVSTSDIVELGGLPCIQDAMRRICESKDIASDLVVYRYSQPKFLDYLLKKATRLGQSDIIDKSRTLERELAKDGLMDDGKEELLQSGRLKLGCDLVSQYVSPEIHQELLGKFDFTALTAHVDVLEAAASIHETTTPANKTQKTQGEDQDGKKRKAAVQASKGVEKLKKANTKGMAKLSSFFQKTPKT
ncbi:ribonuclease H2, subunit B [Phellopilus nigrolimitatus]|nr:ribonuclease H2, subunit B [Phellopilus nigrolimitatus]